MINYVMNPASKKSRKRSKSRGSYKRRLSKKQLASLARGRKISRRARLRYAKRYAKKSAKSRIDGYMKRLLCSPRSAKRIRREKARLCPGSSAFPGWHRKSPSSSVSLADIDPMADRGSVIFETNPRRAKFGYRRRRNPVGSLAGSLTSAFSGSTIKTVLPIMSGMVIANFGRRFIGDKSFTPGFLKSGEFGNLAVGVGVAGLASMLTGRFMPGSSGSILVGGVAEALVGMANKLFGRNMLASCGGCQGLGCIGCGALPMLLAGGTADGGVYLNNESGGEASAVFQNQTVGMVPVNQDVLDSFEGEDVF